MESVLEAMQTEEQRLFDGASLRAAFWSDVVDFVGNFVHRCHRAKEEALFGHLVEAGAVASATVAKLEQEHRWAGRTTAELCEAISDGDWERTLRLTGQYVSVMRAHMAREDRDLLSGTTRAALDIAAVREAFDALEPPQPGRRATIALVQRLAG